MNTITPTSGIELLVHLGIDHLREKTTSPDRISARAPADDPGPTSPRSHRSKPRSGDYSCFQLDLSSSEDDGSSLATEDARPRLLELPAELQYMIAAHLAFADMQRLRRTCRHFRSLLSPEFVRAHFGGDEAFIRQLTSHCQSCLERPGRRGLVLQPIGDDQPPSSQCFRCAVAARDLRVGTKVPLANARSAWVCRWCGWPIAGGSSSSGGGSSGGAPSWAHEQFHVGCYDRYHRVLWGFLVLGFAQFAVGVAAAALSLLYFRGDPRVFAPAVASFALLWVCVGGLAFRGNRVRTYGWVGGLELVILGLWIPPIYAVAERSVMATATAGGPVEKKSAVAALAFYGLNVIFRLLNVVGNIILTCEYDMTKHYAPGQSLKRRLLNTFMAGLIYWTYPQCVEQRYPPDYN